MKNLIRILTATLLLAACVSAAAPGSANAKMGLQEGPAPVPLCDPTVNKKCQMPEAPSAAPAHR
jgi:hypothetical protein